MATLYYRIVCQL